MPISLAGIPKAKQPTTYETDPNLENLMEMQPQVLGLPEEMGESGTPGYGPGQIDPITGMISGEFEGANQGIPLAQIDLSQIYNPEAPPEVQAMIGGQGYDPQTLAMMRAGAVEDVSNAALPQMGAMRRGLSQAGLTNSPAGAAYLGNIGRMTGQAQSGALRDISINNAEVGNTNRMKGLDLAHSYAMEKANRLFQGMGANLNAATSRNSQQANLVYGAREGAINTAFNQNPFQPGAGQGLESAAGTGFSGASQAIGNLPQRPAKLPNTINSGGDV